MYGNDDVSLLEILESTRLDKENKLKNKTKNNYVMKNGGLKRLFINFLPGSRKLVFLMTQDTTFNKT